MRILLVDDDPSIVRVLAEFLADEGHESAAARDYPSALAHLAGGRWDAIISDSLAPPRTPLASDEVARFDELARHAPLIVLSAKPWASATATMLPAVAVIPKPFDLDELLAALEAARARRD